MKIIDRYLFKQFLWAWLIGAFTFVGLFVVFDAFTNLEEFLRYAGKQGGLLKTLVGYYFGHSLLFFDRVESMLTLVAAMFTVALAQRNNEMTALLAAGIPRFRILLPVLLGGVLMAFLAVANRELVLPSFGQQLALRPQDLTGDTGRAMMPRYDNETNILIRGSAIYWQGKRVSKPNFLLPPELSEHGRMLIAENAYHRQATGQRPAGYLLDGVTAPANIGQLQFAPLDGRKVILTAKDVPWLEEDQCFVVSNVPFDQLAAGNAWISYSPTAKLIAGLWNRSLDFGPEIRVAVHCRIVQPLLDITLLLLGLPIVVRRESRNVFVAIGLAALLVGAFFVVVNLFQYLGSIYSISPALAAWGPLLVGIPAAAVVADAFWS